jgi:phosphoribosylformylglycinamidine synthase subunit PurQ / glutaminase
MRVGGTNRDADAASCLEDQGVVVEVLHLNDVLRRRNLGTYHGLVFPGGFAYGDYVRAGAIWGKKVLASLKEDLKFFVEAKKPILGICNGFQVLVEAGLLPDINFEDSALVSLATNKSTKFECRWVNVKKNAKSNSLFLKEVNAVSRFPVAHGEGRFVTSDKAILNGLAERNQIALQYSKKDGDLAEDRYPENPNGSVMDIAGISNSQGNVLGLMPHPEDAYWGYQTPEWVETTTPAKYGDGVGIFKSMVDHIEQNF